MADSYASCVLGMSAKKCRRDEIKHKGRHIRGKTSFVDAVVNVIVRPNIGTFDFLL